jgi:autoinducer 2-degrading protein
MIHILARWRARENKHAEVLALVDQMKLKSTAEPGNHRYDVYQNCDDPHQFLLDELYESEEAVQAHRNSDHFKTLVETQIAPMLAARSSEKREINT